MVFQSYALFPNMTVYDNVAFGLLMQRLPRQDIAERTARMLELIDMTDKSAAYPHQLSGGQQQRVALARSLAVRPKLMLMDEPLSALDAKIRRHLRTEIRRIQRELGMTTIFVTHDQEEALTLSDRICVMNEGRIEQVGTPEEVYARPLTTFVARFIGNYNVLSAAQISAMLEGAELPRTGGAYVPDDGARNVIALAARTVRAADRAAARTAEETSAGNSDSAAAWRMPAVAFAIRPEAIRIVDTAGRKLANADERIGGDLSLFNHDSNARSYELEGTAIDSSVLGALHRYTIQVRDLTLTVDALNTPGQRRLEPGSTVRIASRVMLVCHYYLNTPLNLCYAKWDFPVINSHLHNWRSKLDDPRFKRSEGLIVFLCGRALYVCAAMYKKRNRQCLPTFITKSCTKATKALTSLTSLRFLDRASVNPCSFKQPCLKGKLTVCDFGG